LDVKIIMRHELPTIDFTSAAEVRAKAESRRTEDVAGLLKACFAGWTPRLHPSGHPLLVAVQQAQRPVAAARP
jgi:hypothetical protein